MTIDNNRAYADALVWRDLSIYADDMRKDLHALVGASRGHGARTERAIVEDMENRRRAIRELVARLELDR